MSRALYHIGTKPYAALQRAAELMTYYSPRGIYYYSDQVKDMDGVWFSTILARKADEPWSDSVAVSEKTIDEMIAAYQPESGSEEKLMEIVHRYFDEESSFDIARIVPHSNPITEEEFEQYRSFCGDEAALTLAILCGPDNIVGGDDAYCRVIKKYSEEVW